MVSSLLTWPAIQAAACDRTDAATPAGPADPPGRPWYGRADDDTRAAREDVPVNRTTPTAVPPTTSAQITSNSTRHGRRRPRGRSSRRDAHKPRVVASTRPHDGASGGVVGSADATVRTGITR